MVLAWKHPPRKAATGEASRKREAQKGTPVNLLDACGIQWVE